ncbi:hypothetical protein [Caballeronia sp. DA-9]|uniref:hypothetical protein n=1 Tax=Caballeronia sp. DA-9 TaxID=3436237 RepID=UPI003F67108B
MEVQHNRSKNLERKLSTCHIQPIDLSGAVDTGPLPGAKGVSEFPGPSMVVDHAIAGFVTFLVMRFVGEMLVEDPLSSSFNRSTRIATG